MSKLPDPTMVIENSGDLLSTRATAKLTNESWIDALCSIWIDALCEMAHEDPAPTEAIIKGLRQLGLARALLRCPENQKD